MVTIDSALSQFDGLDLQLLTAPRAAPAAGAASG
jgi:hypothetical protein